MGAILSRHSQLDKRNKNSYSRLPSDDEDLPDIEPTVTDCCAIPLSILSASFCHVPSIDEIIEPTPTEMRGGTITLRNLFDKPSSAPLAVRTTPVKGSIHPYEGLRVSLSKSSVRALDTATTMPQGKIPVGHLSLVSSPESASSSVEYANCPNRRELTVQHQATKAYIPCLRRSRSSTW